MNEREKEIIREIRGELKYKKHPTPYEKGQLDLIKRLRKKKPESKLIKALEVGVLCLGLFALLSAFYVLYKNITDGSFAVESASQKLVKNFDDYEYAGSHIIKESKAVAFISYDCTPVNRVTKGIQNCKGKYYVFLNKINCNWVVNESSKTVIW